MNSIETLLAKSKELRDAATPGPWVPTHGARGLEASVVVRPSANVYINEERRRSYERRSPSLSKSTDGPLLADCRSMGILHKQWAHNASFIAHAGNTSHAKDDIIKIAVEALMNPYVCADCGERADEKWGRSCAVGDQVCKWILDNSKPLSRINALAAEAIK